MIEMYTSNLHNVYILSYNYLCIQVFLSAGLSVRGERGVAFGRELNL